MKKTAIFLLAALCGCSHKEAPDVTLDMKGDFVGSVAINRSGSAGKAKLSIDKVGTVEGTFETSDGGVEKFDGSLRPGDKLVVQSHVPGSPDGSIRGTFKENEQHTWEGHLTEKRGDRSYAMTVMLTKL